MPAFETDFLVLLYDVARQMRTRADQRARARGMTRAQWMILKRLDRQPGLTQNELAGIVEVEPITIARLVDRLEARGLVERRPAAHDRRIRHLFLTDEGRQLRAAVGERLGRPPAGFDALSEAEARQLRDLLAKVADGS